MKAKVKQICSLLNQAIFQFKTKQCVLEKIFFDDQEVCDKTASLTYISMTGKLLKRAIRMATKNSYNRQAKPTFNALNILSITVIYMHQIILLMFDYVN